MIHLDSLTMMTMMMIDDDESIFGGYKKTKSGQDILDEYTKSSFW